MWNKSKPTKEPQNETKAYEYAVFLLSLQLRTVGEVKEKMDKRGYPSSIIEKTIAQLTDQKYLNDERYAQVFLENLKTYKNLGYYGIKKKFMMKKLPNDLTDRVLEEGLSPAEELKIAKRFLKKEGIEVSPSADEDSSANSYSTYDEKKSKQKQKLAQKLKARGFRGDVVSKLVF